MYLCVFNIKINILRTDKFNTGDISIKKPLISYKKADILRFLRYIASFIC
jgi:hypothetical protein